MTNNYLVILLISIISFTNLNGQQIAPCGTEISATDMENFYNRDRSHLQNGHRDIVYIPMTYHLVSNDDGTGGYTLNEAFDLHCTLAEDFVSSEIILYIHDIVYHNNTTYYTMPNGTGTGGQMFNNENVDNTCNVFIVGNANAGNSNQLVPVCGYSYLAQIGGILNRNGIVLDRDCTGGVSTTLTHELGHYLNLPHTFSGWENQDYFGNNNVPDFRRERVDGSNCSTAGDGFCDTPPDYLSERWDCNVSIVQTDPNGADFNSDQRNYMSYSSDECTEYFMPEQSEEMNAAVTTYRPYLLNNPVPDLSPLEVTSTNYPEDNETDISNHSITFTWDEIIGAEGYIVQFSQGNFANVLRTETVSTNSLTLTDIPVNQGFQWRVKPYKLANVCTEYSTIKNFSTSEFSIDVTPENVLCSGETNGAVTVDYAPNLGNGIYKLYQLDPSSFTSVLVEERPNNVFNNLSPGSYKIEVELANGEISQTQFIISDADPIEIEIIESNSSLNSIVTGGNAPYVFVWSNGSSDANNNNPVNGNNTLFVTDVNGCFKSAEKFFGEEAVISSIKNINELAFNLYPNPVVGDVLNVNFTEEIKGEVNIEFFTVTGKKILNQSKELNSRTSAQTIDISSLAKGIYFIKIAHNGSFSTQKIIK